MERVLQIFGEPLASGGQEAFIMNIYRNIDRARVQFDFFTPFGCTNNALREEIESLGGKVYEKSGNFTTEGDKSDFISNLGAFLKEHRYNTVHIHSGSIFSLAFGAKLAKKNGAKKVVVHSHATGNNNLKYKIIKAVSPFIFKGNATDYCACSKSAAAWKFPRSVINKNEHNIINNGIDTDRFTFLDSTRERYRAELGLDGAFVLCHIGRFGKEKNHAFLLEIFKAIKEKNQNTKLLLIGEGPELDNIKELAKEHNGDVLFLGVRTDISEVLQASDVFVFPSLFEGLGIAAIEAQATGLPTVCSEGIPDEANVTELFSRLDLALGAKEWAKTILSQSSHQREKYAKIIKERGYDAKLSADKLLNIYLEENKVD